MTEGQVRERPVPVDEARREAGFVEDGPVDADVVQQPPRDHSDLRWFAWIMVGVVLTFLAAVDLTRAANFIAFPLAVFAHGCVPVVFVKFVDELRHPMGPEPGLGGPEVSL